MIRSNIPLHQRKRSAASLSNEYETPHRLFLMLCDKFGLIPILDAAANFSNTKCPYWYNESDNALTKNWDMDTWCNPPHSLTKQFVKKADEQWQKNNINILMLIPANSICANYCNDIFENNHATYHRINKRPVFLVDGKPLPQSSRNSYFSVVWKEEQQ